MRYMFRTVFLPIIRSSRTLNAASGMFQAYLMLPLAVKNKKAWHIPDAVCTVLEPLMLDGETCRAQTILKNIIKYCILLAVPKRIH